MAFQRFSEKNTLSPEAFYNQISPVRREASIFESANESGISSRGVGDAPMIAADDDLANQFIVFQVLGTDTNLTVAEASTVEPVFEGSPDKPDVCMGIEMQSFHVGQNEDVDKNTRATMRLIIGKDKNSSDRFFENVYWTVTAGLSLFNEDKNRKSKPEEFKADITKSLGNRAIEIPGGLANMTFEVVKHKEPKWWQRAFGFLQSDVGKSLISVVGFPGITEGAINMLDEMFERFDKNSTEVLFGSRPMILALTKKAKLDYTSGISRIRLGCLNPGFCVLARGRDFHTLANANAFFYPHYGLLVPSEVSPGDLVSGNYVDPFKNVTYAVFKIRMAETKLNVQLA